VLPVQQVPAHGPRPAAGPAEAALAIESPASSELDEARAARAESRVPAEPVRETDGVAEVPRLNQFLNRALERFDAVRLGEFSPAEQLRQLEQIDARMTRVIGLAGRLVDLPLVVDPQRLAQRLTDLAGSDIGKCLREMTRLCTDLGAPSVAWEGDPDGWIDLLDRTIDVLERRGAPEIQVLPGPDGSLDGPAPRRAVRDLTVRDSRAITYGVGNSLHIVHDCPAEPVIEVAELLDYDPATDTEAWFHSVQPLRTGATSDLRTRINRSSGISVGTGNSQASVFVHRIGECAVNLGAVIAVPRVREAILAYHRAGEQTTEAMATVRRAVRRSVSAIDVDALVPDSLVARAAADGQAAPRLRGRGPALTIRHGAGVAVGWNTDITSELRKRVGRPTVH
jgi:hypothetical protein